MHKSGLLHFFTLVLALCFFLLLGGTPTWAIGPSIAWVKVAPSYVSPDGKSRVTITAKVTHPQGASALKEVVVNLSPIGGFGNSKMGDDGWLGDERPRDGIYTILVSVARGVSFGRKLFVITAFDYSGWKTFQEGVLDVLDIPSILSVSASRSRVPADGKTPLLISARMFNPTGLTRIKYVLADLSAIGGGKRVLMRNDGKGEDAAIDEFWSIKTVVPKTVPAGAKALRIAAINYLNNVVYKDVSITIEK